MRSLKLILTTLAVLTMALLVPTEVRAWCTPRILQCGDGIDSSTVTGHDDVSRYNCTGNTRFNGKAHVYKITHPGDSLWIRLEWQGDADHEIGVFVLTACNRNNCIAYDAHRLDLDLPAAPYWVIVDSRTDVGTTYRLRIFCGDVPLPVELISFAARSAPSGIELLWSTASEMDNDGFVLERQPENSEEWTSIAFVRGQGTTSARTDYSYMDRDVQDGATYAYRLIAVETNGAERELSLVVVTFGNSAGQIPSEFRLLGSYPNPFNPSTRVEFEVPSAEPMALDVYDVQGRLIKTLAQGVFEPGRHAVEFNANSLPSGVYFIRFSGSFGAQFQKVMLLK